eukprot:GHRQ01023674.1.p3 GENE.GHRQ01023674.1~~GHRQ01023674.1.p3  ORF type:complete len:102 (-),score=42.52 GHRQ01023674.1:419-724(-)
MALLRSFLLCLHSSVDQLVLRRDACCTPAVDLLQGGTLLARLGLKEDIIRCVIATRDIVPRAFSCDYSPVAELLRSWGPSWRDHSCLAGGATGAAQSAGRR